MTEITFTVEKTQGQFFFDYESAGIEEKGSRALENHANEIDKKRSRVIEDIINIGERLQIAREILANHGNGTFCAWVEGRLGLNRKAASRYLSAATATKSLGHGVTNFTPTALYELGSKLQTRKGEDNPKALAALKACEEIAKLKPITKKIAKEALAVAEAGFDLGKFKDVVISGIDENEYIAQAKDEVKRLKPVRERAWDETRAVSELVKSVQDSYEEWPHFRLKEFIEILRDFADTAQESIDGR